MGVKNVEELEEAQCAVFCFAAPLLHCISAPQRCSTAPASAMPMKWTSGEVGVTVLEVAQCAVVVVRGSSASVGSARAGSSCDAAGDRDRIGHLGLSAGSVTGAQRAIEKRPSNHRRTFQGRGEPFGYKFLPAHMKSCLDGPWYKDSVIAGEDSEKSKGKKGGFRVGSPFCNWICTNPCRCMLAISFK